MSELYGDYAYTPKELRDKLSGRLGRVLSMREAKKIWKKHTNDVFKTINCIEFRKILGALDPARKM